MHHRRPRTALALFPLILALGFSGCAATPARTTPNDTPASPSAGAAPPTTIRPAAADAHRRLSQHHVSLQTGGASYTITLYDNPTALSLLDQLPLTITSADYPGYDEKVLRLTRGLSMQGAPSGDDPKWPEVGWYEPGQWIALYYGHIGYYPGKVPLGTIDATNEQIRAIPSGATITLTNTD